MSLSLSLSHGQNPKGLSTVSSKGPSLSTISLVCCLRGKRWGLLLPRLPFRMEVFEEMLMLRSDLDWGLHPLRKGLTFLFFSSSSGSFVFCSCMHACIHFHSYPRERNFGVTSLRENHPTFSSLFGEGMGGDLFFTPFEALGLSPYFSPLFFSCVMVADSRWRFSFGPRSDHSRIVIMLSLV